MRPVACPKREDLEALCTGQLPAEVLAALAGHLDSCDSCLAVLSTLAQDADPLLAALGQPPASDRFLEEPECQRAVARFEAAAFGPVPSSSGCRDAEVGKAAHRETPQQRDPGPGGSPLRQLGQYQLLEQIGHGGMGRVYKALHVKLQRVVAVKMLSTGRWSDPAAVARFQREMAAIGGLDHPHIVRPTDAGEADGIPFLVMDFLEGTDLSRLVKRRGPLPLADACELVRQAALGLGHAHAHGLVHRDVKPSNLLLTPAGQVKVLDLGLALLRGDAPAGAELTEAGQVVGTLDYMAPEQASATHAVSIRADIYSLGCTLYELLAGRPPFSGPPYQQPLRKMQAHAEEAVAPIRRCRPDVPEALAAVLDRLVAKDPADRFATAADVARALGPFTSGCNLSGLLSRDDSEQRDNLGVPRGADPGLATRPQPKRSPITPRRTLAVCAAALLLGLVAVGAYQLWRPPLHLERLTFYLRQEQDNDRTYEWDLLGAGVGKQELPIDMAVRPLRDDIKLHGRFNRPTFWYLLWIDTNGGLEIVPSQAKEAQVRYPARDDQKVTINPADPPGVHLVLLVAGSVAPAEGESLLRSRLEGLGKPVAPLHRWTVSLRGPKIESGPAIPVSSDYLQAIQDRLPPGLEPIHAVFLRTAKEE